MKTMRACPGRTPRRLLAVVLLMFLPAMSAQAGAIDALKRFLSGTGSFSATFSLSVQSESHSRMTHSSGRLAAQKPGKFRWEVERPDPQLIVGNGETIWIYDPDLAQVSVRKTNQAIGATPAALLAGSDAVLGNFTLREAGKEEGLTWVEAVPKTQESGFSLVRVGFTDKGELKAMRLFDNFGQITTIRFQDVRKNTRIPAALFQFVPPEGVEVLESD
ncbi:MAG: outer membrane lipoprotein chaperone LolA [Zoogloeaceae bacterium]|jgi:outer membrane lipoprotein carrier protein|nr:outer membrane lipoprotein chaperone LolA [Zoogloeaceae bacterium]